MIEPVTHVPVVPDPLLSLALYLSVTLSSLSDSDQGESTQSSLRTTSMTVLEEAESSMLCTKYASSWVVPANSIQGQGRRNWTSKVMSEWSNMRAMLQRVG